MEFREPLSIDGLSQERMRKIPVEKFQNKEFFLSSVLYVFQGLMMIISEGLWKVFLLQFVIFHIIAYWTHLLNSIVLGIVLGVAFGVGIPLLAYIWIGVFVLVSIGCFMLLCIYGYQLNDAKRRVSEKAEMIMKEADPDPLFECWHCSETCGTYFLITFLTGIVEGIIIGIYVLLFIFVIMWIPMINIIVPFLFAMITTAYFSFKIVFVRKGNYFKMFPYIKDNIWVFLGFGCALALVSHIPLIGRIEAFIGAVGFTQFYLHYEYFKNQDGPRDTSALIPPTFGEEDGHQDSDEEQEQNDNFKEFEGPPVEDGPKSMDDGGGDDDAVGYQSVDE